MPSNPYSLDWAKLAFSKTDTLSDLDAVFIAAPREISRQRITDLLKTYLPKQNVILGLAKEKYIEGFSNQLQFKTLNEDTVIPLFSNVNSRSKTNHAYVLKYSQIDLKYILNAATFKKVIFINGSWQYVFHTSAVFYTLTKSKTDYELVSPFLDDSEMTLYEETCLKELKNIKSIYKLGSLYNDQEMIGAAEESAKKSFDYCFQTGLSLGKKRKTNQYELIARTFNEVVPSPCYALHHGSARETNFSPPNDLNHYDTVHAEVSLLLLATRTQLDLNGASIFINLLPCPPCARMIALSGIKEIVYVKDHSEGYAINLLEKSGKIVRRLVT